MVGAPGEAAAKCANRTSTEVVLVIDREIAGVYPNSPEGTAAFQAAFGELDPADSWMISLLCHEAQNPETGEVMRRQAIYVNTVGDVAGQGEAWLREIAEAQGTYRRENGTLAPGLTELLPRVSYRLRYYIQPMSSPLSSQFQMTVAEAGWVATFDPGVGTVCYLFSGKFAAPHPELVSDVPRCFVTGESSPRTSLSTPLQIRISQ
jgi:hypothetical protein